MTGCIRITASNYFIKMKIKTVDKTYKAPDNYFDSKKCFIYHGSGNKLFDV